MLKELKGREGDPLGGLGGSSVKGEGGHTWGGRAPP